VKHLRKAILDEMGLGDMCAARVYVNGQHYPTENDLVKDIGFNSVEIETYLKVHFAVAGKGSSYVTSIEVSPSETMDVIRTRVPFYKMFAQRRYTLQLEGGEPIDECTLAGTFWRDSGIKDGSRLLMKEPARERAVQEAEDASDDQNESGVDQDVS
jgi:hypothetical protein